MNWEQDPKQESTEHALFGVLGGAMAMEAFVKWDGCTHLWLGEDSDEDPTYIHACDLDELIEALTALRDKAREHFGKDWPQ